MIYDDNNHVKGRVLLLYSCLSALVPWLYLSNDPREGFIMKAAVWTKNNVMEIQEIPIPEVTTGNVKIKVTGCGVCGTDVHIFKGEVPLAKPPQVLGHEVCGEIVEVAPGITNFKPGDRIAVNPVVGCGVCIHCREGQTNLCPRPTIIGYARCGGFAQYTTVPQTHIHPLPPEIDVKGGILAETLACVINGYDRLNLKAGSSVLILGAGSVGLLWLSLIAKSVVTRIYETEIVPYRGSVARKLGANHVFDASQPGWVEQLKAMEPEGVDYIIDTTGTAQAIQETIGLVRKGGTFMIFGVCPDQEKITISPYDFFAKEISLVGAKMPPQTLDRAVKIIQAGIVDCDAIVPTTMPLSELATAIDYFQHAKDKHIKILIDPWL